MQESRTTKSVRNYKYDVIAQVLMRVLDFVNTTAFIRVLGSGYLGVNNLFQNLLYVISLADLGLAGAMAFSYYMPLAQGDHKKLAALTTFYRKIYLVIAGTITVIGLLMLPLLPHIINMEEEIPHIPLYFILSLANVVASYLFVYKTTVLTADQNGYIISRINIIVDIGTAALRLVLIFVFKSYLLFLIVGIVRVLLKNVIASFFAQKRYPFLKESAQLTKTEKKDVFQYVAPAFVHKLTDVVGNAADYILTSVMVGTLYVGYYSNYSGLQNVCMLPLTILITSVTSSVGNLAAEQSPEKNYHAYKQMSIIGFIGCGILIPCFTALSGDFIRMWAGEEYVVQPLVLAAISLNMFTDFFARPLWPFRDANGLFKDTRNIKIAQTVLNVILSVWLGYIMGLAGIIFGTALSRLITASWYEPKVIFQKCFHVPMKVYVGSYLIGAVSIGGLTVLSILFVRMFHITSWIRWGLCAVILVAGCGLISVLLMCRRDGFKELFRKVLLRQ